MFGFRKKRLPDFDPTGKRPVIRCSSCTGEKTAGYREGKDGPFHDIMLIRDDADLREFLQITGFREDQITNEY